MTDSERKILIKHYAKVIVEHNLWGDESMGDHRAYGRTAERHRR